MSEGTRIVYMMIAPPGAGKSTIARQYVSQGAVCICRDDIRAMLNGGTYDFRLELESNVKQVADVTLQIILDNGFDVILDETNCDKKHRKDSIDYIHHVDPSVVIVAVQLEFDTEECIRRREADPKGLDSKVWREVIERFATIYEPATIDEGFFAIHTIGK